MRELAFREFKRLHFWRIRCHNIETRDAHMALALMWYIRWFDERIFGASARAPIIVHDVITDYVAYYVSFKSGEESYFIYPHRMERKILHDLQILNDEVSVTRGAEPVSMRCRILAIAAHEVRHRLQASGVVLRRFSPSLEAVPRDPWLRDLWEFERVQYWLNIERGRRIWDDPRLITSSLSIEEFDARMVERIIAERYGAHITERELVNLVLTEAEA
ncbi:MAG: hypothetical protein IT405_02190 [Candidatus Yanofskybacteria bacterium]|nr:hypothetical protein [Candidatus Yanofskybacteria bacterium]